MKQHPLCTDCEDKIDSDGSSRSIRTEARMVGCRDASPFSRARSGKVLGWAALASLFGEASSRDHALHRVPSSSDSDREATTSGFRISRRKRNARSISSCRAVRRRSICFDYKPNLASAIRQRHARLGSRQPAIDRHDRRPGALSRSLLHTGPSSSMGRPEPGSAICFPTPRAWSTISPSSSRPTPTPSIMSRQSCS